VSDSSSIKSGLPGSKYISLGGGNAAGRFTSAILGTINTAINNGTFSGYNGIVFDIEEGDSGLYSNFATAFQSAKNKGFKVLVTVSHSAPYGISDFSSLMDNVLKNTNVDYMSPQLYTSGSEGANDYSLTGTYNWTKYAATTQKIIPSIVRASFYSSAQTYFKSKFGITLAGFVQWAQS